MMMMMMLRRNTRGKLGCCLPLKNLVAPYHSREADPNDWNEYARMDWDEYARMECDKLLQSRPLPPRERFNRVLGRFLRLDLHPAVISLNRQMVLHGIARDEYNLSSLVLSYCHLNQLGFGLSVMGNVIKMGIQFDAIALDSLIRSFLFQKKGAEFSNELLLGRYCKTSHEALFKLIDDFDDTSIEQSIMANIEARVRKGANRPENTHPDAEPYFLQDEYDMRPGSGLGREVDMYISKKIMTLLKEVVARRYPDEC